MTREEAIIQLDYLKDFKTPDQVKALDMAIKALKQEPCEDAISRQAALKLFFSDDTEYTGSEICNMVRDLPLVNPQYTEDEIQKMQDLEQAELEKAYELGRAEGQEIEDAISRQAAVNIASGFCHPANIADELAKLPPVNPNHEAIQFAKWVASEIFDDNWEYNNAFDELACRKLAKLGIVRAKGDEWELIESQESEGKE